MKSFVAEHAHTMKLEKRIHAIWCEHVPVKHSLHLILVSFVDLGIASR